MGCKYSSTYLKTLDNKEIEKTENINKSLTFRNNEIKELTSDETVGKYLNNLSYRSNMSYYEERMLIILNEIRSNPSIYSNYVENSISNIQTEKKEIYIDDKIVTKDKLIYKSTVKVSLHKGEEAFYETAEILRKTKPMNPLIFDENLVIPLPDSEQELNSNSYLENAISKIGIKNRLKAIYKDLIKDPETSALLMMIDDSDKSAGRKRKIILNPDIKYIGISSKFYPHSFVAVFCFSSKDGENLYL